MKMLKPLSSFAILTLALTVTVGSMYVTVSAASRQQDAEVAPVPAAEELPAAEEGEQFAPPLPVEAADAGIDPEQVLHNRQHHVGLDSNGGFTGRLSTLSKPDGTLMGAEGMIVRIIRDGSIVTSTTTTSDGTFSVTGLNEGVVGLLAFSDNGLLLFSVRLMKEEQAFASATPVRLESKTVEFSLSTAIVSGADLSVAKDLIFNGLPSKDTRFSESASEEEHQYPHGDDSAESSTCIVHHQVQLQADGTLEGQINLMDPRTGRHREVDDLTLHFIRNGEHVVATEVEPSGQFHVPGLAPGVYSIVTTGEDGVLAMGIHLIGAFAAAEQTGKYKLTSVAQSLDLAVSPMNAGNFNAQNAAALTDGNVQPSPAGAPGAPVAGGPLGGVPGGAGGGLGGGGGGVGGGGGLGGVLGAAAAGAIGYAIGNDDSSPSR